MCEHRFIEVVGTKLDFEKSDNGRIETTVRRKACHKCYKTKTEIELEQQLAAANAELAELKKQNAELFPYYQDHCEGALIPATEYQQWIKRAEQAEASCAAYKKALDIAMSTNQSHETYCKVEAALEGKP